MQNPQPTATMGNESADTNVELQKVEGVHEEIRPDTPHQVDPRGEMSAGEAGNGSSVDENWSFFMKKLTS